MSTTEKIPQLTLGWRLQMAMKEADLTALDMAAELDVSRDTVARWIHDETVPHRLFLQAWAARTGVPFDWLAEGSKSDPKADKSPGRGLVTDNKSSPERARRHRGKAVGSPDRPRRVSLSLHQGRDSQLSVFCRRHIRADSMKSLWPKP